MFNTKVLSVFGYQEDYINLRLIKSKGKNENIRFKTNHTTLDRNNAYIDREDLKEFEQRNNFFNHGLDLQKDKEEDSNNLEVLPYLDQSNPSKYAPEIDLAIQAYNAVVMNAWGNPSQTIPAKIKLWLDKEFSEQMISEALLNRIATIATPLSSKKSKGN